MKATSHLHQLIRSMNMSEKRHFKVHSSRHVIRGQNRYLELFDAIAGQAEYDEELLKRQFAGKRTPAHLPAEKHYLYGHVLEALNSFHKDKTFLSRHASMLISIELLYNRGLFEQCRKLINKAKKEAYSLEKFSMLLIILRWETLIHIKNEDEKSLNRNMEEELRVLEMMRIQYTLMRVAFNMQVQIDRNAVTEGFVRQCEQQLKANLPASEQVDSFWAKYYYHSTMGLIASVQEKQMLRYHSYKEIKRIMETAPQFIIDLPGIYHLNSNNLVAVMFLLKKYQEAELLIRHQRSFMQGYGIVRPALSRIIFLNTHENELFLYYKTKQQTKAAALVKTIEPEVKKYENTFSPQLFDLLFFMAVTCLVNKDHKGAARWINRILNAEKEAGLRKELQASTRLLYIVVLYESGDRLLESRLNSTRRYLAREPHFRAQSLLLEMLRMLSDGVKTSAQKELIRKKTVQVKKEFRRSGEEGLYKQFDFTRWIEDQLD